MTGDKLLELAEAATPHVGTRMNRDTYGRGQVLLRNQLLEKIDC